MPEGATGDYGIAAAEIGEDSIPRRACQGRTMTWAAARGWISFTFTLYPYHAPSREETESQLEESLKPIAVMDAP